MASLAAEELTVYETVAETATQFKELGISFMPVDGRIKEPDYPRLPDRCWKHLQTRLPTDEEIAAWFDGGNPATGIAAITGQVSGGLIIRDFDKKVSYHAWRDANPELAAKCPTEKSLRGFHVYVRVSGTKTVFDDRGDGEIRGEGNFTVSAPSVGKGGELYQWLIPLDVGIPEANLEESGLDQRWDGQPAEKPPKNRTRSGAAPTLTECGIRGTLSNSLGPLLCNSASLGTEERIERAIRATQPTDIGQRRRCLFRLAQKLKGIPELASASRLEEIAWQWWRSAYNTIGTKEVEVTVADFLTAYNCVRYPDDSDPVGSAAERARLRPVLKCVEECRSPTTKLLAAVCYELSLAQHPKPFYLSCRDAARVTGRTDPRTGFVMAAEQMRKLEERWGAIKCVVKPDKKNFKAGRYVFTGAI